MADAASIEESEQKFTKLIESVEWRGAQDPIFQATKLRKILHFAEEDRLAILAHCLEQLFAETRKQRLELESERASKNELAGEIRELRGELASAHQEIGPLTRTVDRLCGLLERLAQRPGYASAKGDGEEVAG
jgi:uncharacterized protein (DUF3084 family)